MFSRNETISTLPRRYLSVMVITQAKLAGVIYFSWKPVFGLPLPTYTFCREYGL